MLRWVACWLADHLEGNIVLKGKIVEQALAAFSDPARRERYFDLYAPGIVLHGYDGVAPGIDSVRRYYTAFWNAFPDARVTAEEILETHDKVVVRFLITGTHCGPILGLNATGKPIRLAGMAILRFEGQKCLERWSVTDSLALAVQLGGVFRGRNSTSDARLCDHHVTPRLGLQDFD